MKCKDCNLCWADPGEDFPTCKADPNWPAPCEYDDEEDAEDDPSCSTCYNADQDTTDKVACCNCCEEYSFYTRA